jgi:hypothetical protein
MFFWGKDKTMTRNVVSPLLVVRKLSVAQRLEA